MKNKNLLIRITNIATLVVLLALAVLIGAFLVHSLIFSRFLPNTFVNGISVSGKAAGDVLETLNSSKDEFFGTPIVFRWGSRKEQLNPEDLGIEIFTEETAKEAAYKNSQEVTILKYFFPGDTKKETSLKFSIDTEKLTEALDKKFNLYPLKSQNANYFIAQGKLQIADGKNGLELDKEKIITQLKKDINDFSPKEVVLYLKDTPPVINKDQLEAQKDGIVQKLKKTIKLTESTYIDGFNLALKDHLDWIKFVTEKEISLNFAQGASIFSQIISNNTPLIQKNVIKIEIDDQKFNEYVDKKFASQMDIPVENVKIYKDAEGKIVIEGRGDGGKQLQRAVFKKALELAINSGADTMAIPVVELKPTITVSDELQKMGIKDVVAIGHTSYYGSPMNRIFNIQVGANKLNGTLITPDEVFSFDKTIGHVSGSTGYLPELVIKPEGTVPEFGGGLCQVSTTVYRAALFAGLPIVERHPHSYAVAYYAQILGHGLDATVYETGPDLKFKNDTGNNLLMQAYVKNKKELYVVLYGTPDGRSVKMDGPYVMERVSPGAAVVKDNPNMEVGVKKQAEKPHVGFKALWYRYITDKLGVVTKEEIRSAYRAVPAKEEVGTAAKPATTTPTTPAAKPTPKKP